MLIEREREKKFTLVPETMSTPCLAWFRACTIDSRVVRASRSSSYLLVHLGNLIHHSFEPLERQRLPSNPVKMRTACSVSPLLVATCC
uniref:Uncharacterized protein n=1 Tax=Oryza brachyantha TaxID=4533 RepID=J3MXT0_ORYBR